MWDGTLRKQITKPSVQVATPDCKIIPLFIPAWDEFDENFCKEPCNAAKRCGHRCPEVCHADNDDSHTTGIEFKAVIV